MAVHARIRVRCSTPTKDAFSQAWVLADSQPAAPRPVQKFARRIAVLKGFLVYKALCGDARVDVGRLEDLQVAT